MALFTTIYESMKKILVYTCGPAYDTKSVKAIESFGNNAIYYSPVWGILEKRYNQPAIIVTSLEGSA